MTTRLWGRPSWPARKLLSPQSALDVCLSCLSCTGGQSIFFLFLLSMPPLKGQTVDPISEVYPETIFCPPYRCLPQPDYLLLFLLSMPPPPSPPSCRVQYSLPRLMRDAEAALWRWLTTAAATWAWKKLLLLTSLSLARLDTPPSTLPHKSTQSATLPASNLVVGLLSGKKGKKSD